MAPSLSLLICQSVSRSEGSSDFSFLLVLSCEDVTHQVKHADTHCQDASLPDRAYFLPHYIPCTVAIDLCVHTLVFVFASITQMSHVAPECATNFYNLFQFSTSVFTFVSPALSPKILFLEFQSSTIVLDAARTRILIEMGTEWMDAWMDA